MIDAAAPVGGIMANSSYPAEFSSDNLRVQLNLLDSAQEAGVEHFLFHGPSCIYPKFAEQQFSKGTIAWDKAKPDGTPRKLLDVGRLTALGWKASIQLDAGLASTNAWFLDHQHEFRQ